VGALQDYKSSWCAMLSGYYEQSTQLNISSMAAEGQTTCRGDVLKRELDVNDQVPKTFYVPK